MTEIIKRKVYICIYEPGNDGLYHWSIFVSNDNINTTIGTIYQVGWGKEKGGPMILNVGENKSLSKSRSFIKKYELGEITNINLINNAVERAYLPKMTIEDHKEGKNCQTWCKEVINTLITNKTLPEKAKDIINTIPLEE